LVFILLIHAVTCKGQEASRFLLFTAYLIFLFVYFAKLKMVA